MYAKRTYIKIWQFFFIFIIFFLKEQIDISLTYKVSFST